jgi:hypothetical protein
MPVQKDLLPLYLNDALDILVFRPDWISNGLTGCEFFRGDVVGVSEGDSVRTWGYPGAARIVSTAIVRPQLRELRGVATSPCNNAFKFAPSPTTSDPLGGFSGAPVFRDDGKLVGIVSEGSDLFGIVICSELASVINQF